MTALLYQRSVITSGLRSRMDRRTYPRRAAEYRAPQINAPDRRHSAMRAVRETDIVGKDELVLAAAPAPGGRCRGSPAHPLSRAFGSIPECLGGFPPNHARTTAT